MELSLNRIEVHSSLVSDTGVASYGDAPSRYRWVVLGSGSLAQGSTAAVFLGLASITPLLRTTYGLSVSGVGTLLGVISAGILLTLLPWGDPHRPRG